MMMTSGCCLKTASSEQSAFATPLLTGQQRKCGTTYRIKKSVSILCTANLAALAASVVLWPGSTNGNWNFCDGQSTRNPIYGRLGRCSKSGSGAGKLMVHGELERAPLTFLTGGWSTIFCRGRSMFWRKMNPMGKMSREKGKRGEREWAALPPVLCRRNFRR